MTTPHDDAAQFPFTDPITGRDVTLVIMGADPSFWDGTIGVKHPGCDALAIVSPDIDAFFCTTCYWNGRVTGAWAVDMARSAAPGVGE